jgi:hypothetical protein
VVLDILFYERPNMTKIEMGYKKIVGKEIKKNCLFFLCHESFKIKKEAKTGIWKKRKRLYSQGLFLLY